jgi:hypothetical protein
VDGIQLGRSGVKRIVEIVPASPGWYARWRFTPERTLSYPVTVWALVEDAGPSTRQVVGVDAGGQWPGGADNIAGADFVRYIYQEPDSGLPDDVFNPVQAASEVRS